MKRISVLVVILFVILGCSSRDINVLPEKPYEVNKQVTVERVKSMGCKCAIQTDEYHGWECSITEGPCMYLYPNSKACAEDYGEGPDAEVDATEDDLREAFGI